MSNAYELTPPKELYIPMFQLMFVKIAFLTARERQNGQGNYLRFPFYTFKNVKYTLAYLNIIQTICLPLTLQLSQDYTIFK